ncbi:hypothetical protein EW145_g3221, partial [Phellinidium pouzarii]
MSNYPYASPTYQGAPPTSPYAQAGGASQYGVAPAQAASYTPYAAPAAAPGAYPHSPYAASAAMPNQAPVSASAYPHSPYAGSVHSGAGLDPRAERTGLFLRRTFTAHSEFAVPACRNHGGVWWRTGHDRRGGTAATTLRGERTARRGHVHDYDGCAGTAVAATYRSPQGVTYEGIQWLPTETSASPPIGIAPAGPDVIASFRGQLPTAGDTQATTVRDYRDERANRDVYDYSFVPCFAASIDSVYREKEENRRRRREEKEAAKRSAAWEAERRAREKAEEKEIRKARERDAEIDRTSRLRRMPSTGAGLGAGLGPTGYDRERSRERGGGLREREVRERERENERELERRMGDLNVSGRGLTAGTRSRRQSMSMPSPSGVTRPIYAEADPYDREYERERERGLDDYGQSETRRSSIYGAPERPSSIYGASERANNIYSVPERANTGYSAPERSSIYAAPERSGVYAAPERSPYRRATSPLPPAMGPGGVPVYPPGH